MSEIKERIIVGLTVPIILYGKNAKKQVLARVDTGATKSSIDEKLAEELGFGVAHRNILIKSAHGSKQRGVVNVDVEIKGEHMNVECTLSERSHMKYRFLIGQNILKKGFLIDPLKE